MQKKSLNNLFYFIIKTNKNALFKKLHRKQKIQQNKNKKKNTLTLFLKKY
jgi:hypothetical protein